MIRSSQNWLLRYHHSQSFSTLSTLHYKLEVHLNICNSFSYIRKYEINWTMLTALQSLL